MTINELMDALDALASHAQVLQNKLEDDMTDAAVILIKEMLVVSGAVFDEDMETGDTQVNFVIDNFASQWDTLGFDFDNLADLLED